MAWAEKASGHDRSSDFRISSSASDEPRGILPVSEKSMDKISWFHRIDLGDGRVTPGIDDTPAKLARLHLPADLTGLSVADIGAWDGFFSFEAEKRGAQNVMAIDSYCWSGDGWADDSGFRYAHAALNSKVETLFCEVMDIDADRLGQFDVVLFLGVLYHLKDPLTALEKVAAITRGRLILETKVDLLSTETPSFAFYQGTEMNSDPTNWWAPNESGLIAMLKSVGFSRVEVVTSPKPLWQRVWRKPNPGESWWSAVNQCRMTVHAWKE
jgi:tRNA (mo5U34)-methyltransferase